METPSHSLYINPEWVEPGQQETEHEVTPPTWEWNGDESMNPFWAVRRLTAAQLAQEAAAANITGLNVQLDSQEFTQVTVGSLQKESTSNSLTVSMPLLSNSAEIKQGVELILRHEPATKAKTEKTRSWKSDQQQIDADRKRQRAGRASAGVERI